jgi:cell division protein FtsB
VNAQIRNAGRNLELDHWTIWNAWHGKIGARAFPKLSVAYHRWIDERSRSELDGLRARIERLEQNHNLASGVAGESDPRRRMGAAKS